MATWNIIGFESKATCDFLCFRNGGMSLRAQLPTLLTITVQCKTPCAVRIPQRFFFRVSTRYRRDPCPALSGSRWFRHPQLPDALPLHWGRLWWEHVGTIPASGGCHQVSKATKARAEAEAAGKMDLARPDGDFGEFRWCLMGFWPLQDRCWEMLGGFQNSELGDNRMISAGGKHLRNLEMIQMGMDQYLLIQFLGGWTSIYQLFWCELQGYQGFDTLPNDHRIHPDSRADRYYGNMVNTFTSQLEESNPVPLGITWS